MQTATTPTAIRQRADRVRGHIIRYFAVQPNRARPSSEALACLVEQSYALVCKAHHDSQPVIQWRAQELKFIRPPLAMQALAKGIATSFRCLWFEEAKRHGDGRIGWRWYHYGSSSKLRSWAAMFVFEKTWKAADRFAHFELMKNENPEPGARRTFVSNMRDEWVARLCGGLTQREIESWVVQEWRLARSRARARGHKHNRLPPRSMSYEDVARWLDEAIGSWQG